MRPLTSKTWTTWVWLALTIPASATASTLDLALAKYGLTMAEGRSFKISQDSLRRGAKKTYRSVIASDGRRTIDLEIVNPVSAAEVDRYRVTRIRSVELLFEDQVTPYQGEISNTIQCPKEMKPKHLDLTILGTKNSVLRANANERLIFGTCDPAQVKQVGFIAVVPHKNALFRFKIFQPATEAASAPATGLLTELSAKQ